MNDWRMKNGVSASSMVLPHLPKGQNQPNSLLSFLELLPHNLRAKNWEYRLKNGLIYAENGAALPSDAPYTPGQRIFYWRDAGSEPRIPFDERIVYEDAHILVADKPHFLPVTPTGRYVQETLLVRLKKRTGLADLAPIHRIDRDTAGLVLFSKNPHERGAYMRLFREHLIEKTYECLAAFQAANGEKTQFPLIRRTRLIDSPHSFMQMQEIQGLPNSETLIERIEINAPNNLARYRLHPKTGKRHQLRVHMNALGLPIVNDGFYPELLPEPDLENLDYSKPLQLLAKTLTFKDPISGKQHHFESHCLLKVLSDPSKICA